MAANRFKIQGARVDSFEEFERLEKDGRWENILYYPERLECTQRDPKTYKKKRFTEVSFKDTDIINCRFIGCSFERCLFIGAKWQNCEFTNCKFYDTNTHKVQIDKCLIDPSCFANNFDLISDTNIAIDLYQELYKNATREHQPEHAVESLYEMKKAESRHLLSQKSRRIINRRTYWKKRIGYAIHNFVSGYGLRTKRVFRLLLLVITGLSILNYAFREIMFSEPQIKSFIDSVYFTCIIVTTVGFGDIAPTTLFGKIFVTLQAILGIVVISIFVSAVTNRTLRAR